MFVDKLEVSPQTKGFSKQVEAFCQSLLGRSSVLPRDEAQDVIHTLIQCLLLVENQLTETQAADMKVRYKNKKHLRIQDKEVIFYIQIRLFQNFSICTQTFVPLMRFHAWPLFYMDALHVKIR
jgi:hypothetical protein